MKMSTILFCLALLLSCRHKGKNEPEQFVNTGLSYARTLEIISCDDFTILRVTKPWQKGDDEIFSYIAARENVVIPDSLALLPVIRIPVKSVVSFSTTHIGFISALNKTETIKGISGKDYFYDSFLRKLYDNGKIVDVGYPPSIDYETIVRINPDVVFLYGLGASEAAIIKRLADAGISTIMISEFLEDHPLGKAEWIKLFAVLFDLKEKGDSLFDAVSGYYNELIPLVRDLQQKPRVLTGLPWKGTWNMAGGSSFTARLIEDAGGDYLWKDDNSREFIPLSLEAVFSRAGDADIWINTGTAYSMSDLISRDRRFENIRAIRKGLVFNNNARLNPSGGNDYWESGTVRPDLILRDLISVFHPEVLEDNELVYYRKLE